MGVVGVVHKEKYLGHDQQPGRITSPPVSNLKKPITSENLRQHAPKKTSCKEQEAPSTGFNNHHEKVRTPLQLPNQVT